MNIRSVIDIRYAQIRSLDLSNGEDIGVALFVQGCPVPHCKGCFNPETWNFTGGKEWTQEVENKFLKLIEKSYIKRISFLGGECLTKENIKEVTDLVKKCKLLFPDKKIWLWSRYNYEEYICGLEIVKYLDYVVDGEFIEELKDISLIFRGSSNQNIWKKTKEGEWCKMT